MSNFSDRLAATITDKSSCLMLGIDPNLDKMPKHFSRDIAGVEDFCRAMIEGMANMICGIKIQMAYFEVFGSEGIAVVERLLQLAKSLHLITLVDGKRNDIGSTSEAYAKAYLADGPLGADALTVNPLPGSDGVLPFVQQCEENGRGIFVLVRMSNPSAVEFQGGQRELCTDIANKVEEWGLTTRSEANFFSSVGAVIGATIPEGMLTFFREEMPCTWFLTPGVGAQGGSMDSVMAVRQNGLGIVIPVSRAVLYASEEKDFITAGKEVLRDLWEEQK